MLDNFGEGSMTIKKEMSVSGTKLEESKVCQKLFCNYKVLYSINQDCDDKSCLLVNGKLRIIAKIVLGNVPYDCSTLSTSKDLQKLYYSMQHSDLIIKSKEGTEFKAHKNILSARNEVFNRMLSSKMCESLTGIINLKDLNSNVVSELLRFIYCEALYDKVQGDAITIFEAAHRFEMEGLKAICLNDVYKKLNPYDVLNFLNFARLYDLEELYSCCILIICA
jgi:speckle-type POZ protein